MRRDLIALPDESKVWVYQADRFLTTEETENIQSEIYDFTLTWTSHGQDVECYGHLFHKLFLVMVADDSNHVSGCSIDSSVHFIQSLGHKYNVDFFDRLNYVIFKNEEIDRIYHNKFKEVLQKGDLTKDTLIFDNLVNNKASFINGWVKPINESWHKRYL